MVQKRCTTKLSTHHQYNNQKYGETEFLKKYAENKLAVLRISLSGSKQFSATDVSQVLGLKRSTASWLLSNLTTAGKIFRVERGAYSFNERSSSFRKPRFGEEIQEAVRTLRNKGVSFVLTGLDILLPFVQHQPNISFIPPLAPEFGLSLFSRNPN